MFMFFKYVIMCYEPGYENLFFQLTARHPEPDNPNWKLFRSEGEVTVYRIVDDYNNCIWEKDIRPDGIRYSLGIYEDNPITQIKSYDRIGDTRAKVSLETLFEANDYLCVERVPQGLGAAKVAYDYFEDLDSF